MTTVLIILILIITVPLLYLATLDGHYKVRRSLVIRQDRKTIFDKLRDFTTWRDWSPWIMHEPDTALTFADTPDLEDGWYSWDGRYIGAGKLTHTGFTDNEKITQTLEFTRPFKSTCEVWWELEPVDDGSTRLHWNMRGCMPFLFRFMAGKMPAMIGKDFETGLHLLHGALVADAERPTFTFEGPTDLPDSTAATIAFSGHIDDMKAAMQEGFPGLLHALEVNNIEPNGHPFTVYHKVDLKQMHFACDMAVPIAQETTLDNHTAKTLPGGQYYKVLVKGSYEFLELAWYQAYAHLQMLKIKPQHARPSREVYENDPREVGHTNEIRTALYIPIR